MTTVTGKEYQTLSVTAGDYVVNYSGLTPYVSIVNNTSGNVKFSQKEDFSIYLDMPKREGIDAWYIKDSNLYIRVTGEGDILLMQEKLA